MDKEIRNRIQRATQAARALLEREYAEQLGGVFDIRADGTIAKNPGNHLDAEQRVLRNKLVAAVDHQAAGGLEPPEAVASYLREAAFTMLNRFVALKMFEARGLVLECVWHGEQSVGFKEFTRLAPGLVQLPDHGYRMYIESLFDEIGREVRVLFDRREPASLLRPKKAEKDASPFLMTRFFGFLPCDATGRLVRPIRGHETRKQSPRAQAVSAASCGKRRYHVVYQFANDRRALLASSALDLCVQTHQPQR
jgi:hypothetical protein